MKRKVNNENKDCFKSNACETGYDGRRTDLYENKKLLAKLIFVAILLLIIWYTFKDSAEDIVEQLENITDCAGGHYAGDSDLSSVRGMDSPIHWLADIIRNSNTGKQFTVLSTALFTVCLHWEAVPAWQQLCIWEKRVWDIRKQPDFT